MPYRTVRRASVSTTCQPCRHPTIRAGPSNDRGSPRAEAHPLVAVSGAAAPGSTIGMRDDTESAKAAGLRYVSDSDPGLSRIRRGRGFSYLDSQGKPVSARRKQRIQALAIPPAWTDVWICAQSRGHLQATGYDDRGRKQYIYHERWRSYRNQETFDRLSLIGASLPAIRAAVAAQLRRRNLDQDRVLAGMVRMLDLTGIRVGNEAYEKANKTIGLCTLRWSHVTFTGDSAEIRYRAKSGQRAALTVNDAQLVRLLKQLQSSRRRPVFAIDGHRVTAGEINGYLTDIAGEHITAKDFRTWMGTVTALKLLLEAAASNTAPTKKNVLGAIDAAAAALRNTRAVCRAHYVHPAVLESYLAGELPGIPNDLSGSAVEVSTRTDTGPAPLAPAERTLLRILTQEAA